MQTTSENSSHKFMFRPDGRGLDEGSGFPDVTSLAVTQRNQIQRSEQREALERQCPALEGRVPPGLLRSFVDQPSARADD